MKLGCWRCLILIAKGEELDEKIMALDEDLEEDIFLIEGTSYCLAHALERAKQRAGL